MSSVLNTSGGRIHFGRSAGAAGQPPLGGWGAEHFAAPELNK